MKIGDVVKVNRPGWCGHGEIGVVVDIPNECHQVGIYVRHEDGCTLAHSSERYLVPCSGIPEWIKEYLKNPIVLPWDS